MWSLKNHDSGHLRMGDPRGYQVCTAFDVFRYVESCGKIIHGASGVSEDGEINIGEVRAYRTNVIYFPSAHQHRKLRAPYHPTKGSICTTFASRARNGAHS